MDFSFQPMQLAQLAVTAMGLHLLWHYYRKRRWKHFACVAALLLIMTFTSPVRFQQPGMASVEARFGEPEFNQIPDPVLVEKPSFEASQAKRLEQLRNQNKEISPQ